MPKTTVRTKDLLAEIEQVKVKTSELKAIVESIPMSSVRKAFDYSVVNLEKKIEKFTTIKERLSLSDEEKELVRKFRASKTQTEVSTLPASKIVQKKKK